MFWIRNINPQNRNGKGVLDDEKMRFIGEQKITPVNPMLLRMSLEAVINKLIHMLVPQVKEVSHVYQVMTRRK